MLTYNRANYTRICLGGLLDSLPEYAKVVVWDNNSNESTKAVLRAFEGHPRLEHIEYSNQNLKLREPTNWFWDNTKDCDFVSKVDDDCLLHKGWCERLLACHGAFPESGVIGSWRFYPDDNDPSLIQKKIKTRDNESIFLNCWVQGSGYLMRRKLIEKMGPLKPTESFPRYCIRAAKKGYLNGFAHPFSFEDHFDDPRSSYSEIKTDEDMRQHMPLSAKQFKIDTVEDWITHNRREAQRLQNAPYEPSFYIGIGAKIRSRIKKIFHRYG